MELAISRRTGSTEGSSLVGGGGGGVLGGIDWFESIGSITLNLDLKSDKVRNQKTINNLHCYVLTEEGN